MHPVRQVSVGELSADIDEELAPIIEVIWRLGLRTWTSCQNQGESKASWGDTLPHIVPIVGAQLGWAYIDFPREEGLAFLTALAQAGPPRRVLFADGAPGGPRLSAPTYGRGDTCAHGGLGARPAMRLARPRLRAKGVRSVPDGPHALTRGIAAGRAGWRTRRAGVAQAIQLSWIFVNG